VAAFSTIGTIDEWTGTNWEPVPVTATSLTLGGTFAYAGSGRVLSIGDNARNGTTDLTAIWETDFRRWLRLTPTSAPTGRSLPAAAYDPVRDTLVVAGGLLYSAGDNDPLGFPPDVWEYRYTALDLGSTCDPMQGARCTSGRCVDGVCCASECAGPCEICNADATLGQCAREVSAQCPGMSVGTGGTSGAPGTGASPGAGGAPGTGGAMAGGSAGTAGGATGGGGAMTPVRGSGGAGGSDGLVGPSGGAPMDGATEVAPVAGKARGLYAGPACNVSGDRAGPNGLAVFTLVLLLRLWRRRAGAPTHATRRR
jgi:hypothetical protein